MKLVSVKINQQHYFSVGYDLISESYILAQVITYMGYYNRYFKISKEEYDWFEYDVNKLIALNQECFAQNTKHPKFFFSEYPIDNTPKQNEKLKFYMQTEYEQNKKRVLRDKILKFLREIDKAEAVASISNSGSLNLCRIWMENILEKLENGILPSSNGDMIGAMKYISQLDCLSVIHDLYEAAADVDTFYSIHTHCLLQYVWHPEWYCSR